MNGWHEVELGEVITLQRGYDLTERERKPGNVPVVSSSGISGYHNEVKVSGPGVVTGRYGTLGAAYYIEEDFWPHNTTLFVKDFHGNDRRFTYYLLGSLNLAHRSAVSAVPGVNRNDLHRLPVLLPPLPTQRRIAQILGRLDDKIEVNRRINRTLEVMAQALFKHWFVDFGPFQDGPFVESELGLIPEGWNVSPLSYFAEIDTTTVNPQVFPDETFNHYSIPALDAGTFPALDKGGDVKSNKYLITSDRMLVSKLNPNTYRIWTVYNRSDYRSFSSTEFINYIGKLPDTWAYLNCLFRDSSFVSEFRSRVTGTTGSRQRVTPQETLSFLCLRPRPEILQEFERIVCPYFKQIESNIAENRTLAATRDYLLPRLLSGEVAV